MADINAFIKDNKLDLRADLQVGGLYVVNKHKFLVPFGETTVGHQLTLNVNDDFSLNSFLWTQLNPGDPVVYMGKTRLKLSTKQDLTADTVLYKDKVYWACRHWTTRGAKLKYKLDLVQS